MAVKFLQIKQNPDANLCSEDPTRGECLPPHRVSRALIICGIIALLIFWPLSTVVLFSINALGLAIVLFFSGLQGLFLIGYAFAVTARKQWWRWFTLASGGLGILMFSLVDAVNLDLHGFFELIILGTAGAAIGHTMVTSVIGPLIFGRILCGWGCWRAMVLERLPIGKGSNRRKGVWAWTSLIGIAVSFVVAYLFAVAPGQKYGDSVWSVIAGVSVYYAAAIALALILHDQRAFCKYLCPTGFILRWTSRPALLHVYAQAKVCNECETCTDVCPMDIPVAERVKMGTSISKGDCILCQRCVESCPAGVLTTGFKK